MTQRSLNVGVVGCGTISGAYFAATRQFPVLNITACADLDPKAAERAASQWGVAALTVDELLAQDDLDMVLNLTVPHAHAPVTLAALEAAKHVYLEKPLALDRAEGQRMLTAAEAYRLCEGAGHPRVRVDFDMYHRQLGEGNVIATLEEGLAKGFVRFVEVGDVHQVFDAPRDDYTRGLIASIPRMELLPDPGDETEGRTR